MTTPTLLSSGETYGSWTVVAFAGTSNGARKYRCRCACGSEWDVRVTALTAGRSSCCRACANHRLGRRAVHGHARNTGKTAEYVAWENMRTRCSNPRSSQWKNYGGRGIRVCVAWQASFPAFLDDVGPRPSLCHSLGRIDGGGHYEPGNVRWETWDQQAHNRRGNRSITANGETLLLCEWARRLGVGATTIIARIDRGWATDRAVLTPIGARDADRRPGDAPGVSI